MSKGSQLSPSDMYKHFKSKERMMFNEAYHCTLLIEVMCDPERSTMSSFCVEAMICETTFWKWVKKHEVFSDLYYFTKMIARELWEKEGRRLRDTEFQIGTINYSFEHWKMMGWTRFGISKSSKIKIEVLETSSPAELYRGILKQAQSGDFTASEFKQLMESVNVGVNIHKVFELQKEIDELKDNLKVMVTNQNVHNSIAN